MWMETINSSPTRGAQFLIRTHSVHFLIHQIINQLISVDISMVIPIESLPATYKGRNRIGLHLHCRGASFCLTCFWGWPRHPNFLELPLVSRHVMSSRCTMRTGTLIKCQTLTLEKSSMPEVPKSRVYAKGKRQKGTYTRSRLYWSNSRNLGDSRTSNWLNNLVN
jgi:hypothetical protein